MTRYPPKKTQLSDPKRAADFHNRANRGTTSRANTPRVRGDRLPPPPPPGGTRSELSGFGWFLILAAAFVLGAIIAWSLVTDGNGS